MQNAPQRPAAPPQMVAPPAPRPQPSAPAFTPAQRNNDKRANTDARGVSRVDFRLSPAGECFCLEVNTIPGMTPLSLVPMAARARGMSYEQLVGRMLELALASRRRRAGAAAQA